MNIPSPPTDNLYKFIAISGLILVAIGLFLTFNLRIEFDKKAFDLSTSNLNLQPLLQLPTDNSVETAQGKVKTKNRRLSFEDKTILIYNKQVGERNAQAIEKSNKTYNEFTYQREFYNKWKIATFAVIFIGVIMMTAGFYLWYVKLQVFQDRILKQDIEANKPTENNA